jgi:mannose-6-phosphate isomerase-like protein (cupin superfamily)
MINLMSYLEKALKEVELYQERLLVSEEEVRVGFEITDSGETATLILKDELEILEGLQNCDIKITLSKETLQQVAKYEKDGFALAGRARMSDVRPINFEFLNREKAPQSIEAIKRLGTYFLLPGRIKIREIRHELAGEAHGASPIPLAYWEGLRSAWYFIDEGQIINEAGEKDPYPQLFIALSGKGTVIVADEEFELQPKRVVYIPPNAIHQIRAKELVELIWIAWDAPM